VSPIPQRTCVGCGRRAPQADLLRFAAPAGVLVAGRGTPGRGAYTCRRLACFEQAVAQHSFNRALRCAIALESGLERLYTDS
jgi:predicted RNA-binding protein YlxR (DUF448 family)